MALRQAGVELVAQGLDSFVSGMGKADDAVQKFGSSGGSAGSAFDKGFSEIVIGGLRKVGELGVEALLKAGQAVTSFVGDSIGLAGDFEAGMLEFQAVAGKDVDAKGLEQFRDLFIDLGKKLPVSTSAVKDAAIEMVKGGIDPAIVAAGGLEQNIKFAAAALGGDLVAAAETSAKLLGGWVPVTASAAEKVDFLTHSTDMLTKAANASSVDVLELRQGIFNAQGIAKVAGVNFDDLTTTLAALAPRFASSSEAGNSLKNMIARLQPTTKPAIAAFQALGLITEDGSNKFYDAQGRFVGFQQASELLKQSLAGLTQQQQAAILQTMFGNDAMGSAAALSELGAAGYQNMADALEKANGVQENATLKQQGFNTALDNAKGSVEALQITLGSALLPVLTDLLENVIAKGINTLTDWVSAIASADDPLGALVTSIDQILPGFAEFARWIGDVIPPALQFVTDHLDAFKGAAIALGIALAGGLGIAAIAGLIATLTNPITLVVAAIGLLGAAWASNWGDIQGKTKAVWGVLQPVLQGIGAWLAEKIPQAIEALSKFWTGTLLPAVETVSDFLKKNVFPILSDLAGIYIAVAIKEVEILAAIWSNMLWPALKLVWSFIDSAILPIMKALFTVEFAIAKREVEALAGLWQKVLWPALQKVGDFIINTVVPAFQSAGNYLSATFGPTLEKVTAWLGNVTGGFKGVSGAVQGVIDWLNNLATSISNLKLPDWLTPGSPTPLEIGLRGVGAALQTVVSPGLTAMQQGLKDIGAAFSETDLIDQITALGEDAMAGFGQGIKDGVRSVIRIINSTADTVQGAFQDAFGAHSPATRIVPVGASITQGLMEGMSSLAPALIGLINQMSTSMIDALKKNKEQMGDQIRQAAEDLTDQARSLAEDINNAIADGFGATASIDRQLARNLDKFKDVLPEYRQYTQGALQQAEQQARQFTDPTEGAKFFKLRSDQILEYAKLQKDLAEAETQSDKDRIRAQMELINAAQIAEINAFNAAANAGQSTIQQIAAAFQKLLQGNETINLPGLLDNPLIAQLSSLINQLQQPPANPWANPPASAQQIYGSGGNTTSYSSQRTYNMPIYTNNTPSALQQSMAIAQAVMP